MRSIQLLAPRVLEERIIPDPPDPRLGELLVKVRAVGVCGSDLHWYLDGRIGANMAGYPQVLGHEPVVEVVRVGPGVTSFQEGDRVVVEPTISCGHCEFCLAGRHNNCVSGYFMGSPVAHGFFLEYALIPAHNATHVPGALSDNTATLIEPVAVIAHMLDLVRISPGDTVAVTGAGPIGLLCASAARSCGASRVYICDRVPHRLANARSLGFEPAFDSASRFVECILDETRGRGVDVVLEAAGHAETINAALAVARPSGMVVLVGLPSELQLPFEIHKAMSKELTIQTVKRSNHCAGKAINLINAGIVPESLITHTLPLAATPQAFETLANYEHGVGKIVIGLNA